MSLASTVQAFAMESDIVDNELSLNELLARATADPDTTGPLRRDTLAQLLKLTQSQSQELKILTAQNIRYFFNDFPEFEEEAINAIYDLCEDVFVNVRLEGYSAITQLSKEKPDLVRRNADVLVQLLQSGEPQELAAVENALLQHLDIDARATLGVLCDQAVPVEEPTDPDEKALRARIRSLVFAFITREAKEAIVEKHATPESEAEKVLVDRLLQAIPKLNPKDTEIIVKGLLLSLRTFGQPSPYGSSLLIALLDKAVVALRNQKQPTRGFSPVLPHLELASFVVLEKQVASALQLLRFYCRHFCNKFVIQKFNKEDQRSLITHIAEALEATSKSDSPGDDNDIRLATLKRQIVDCSSFLLEPLGISSRTESRHVQACVSLLQGCKERKQASNWVPPPNLVSVMKKISDSLEAERAKIPEVQQLIRSLASAPSTPSSSSTQGRGTPVVDPTQLPTGPRNSFAPRAPRASLPKRPSSAMALDRQPSPNLRPQAMTTSSEKRTVVPTEPTSERPPKRPRSDMGFGPSLLNRMGNTSESSTRPAARANQVRSTGPAQREADDSLRRSSGGISIKGAATKQDQGSSSGDGGRRAPQTSLLDRMTGTGGSALFADSSGRGRHR